MNADFVISAAVNVTSQQRQKVETIFQTAGGWEGWLQCELACAFWANQPGSVMREVRVWGDKRACDLQFEVNKFIVELKCLGWKRIQTSQKAAGSFGGTPSGNKAFVDEVLEDRLKIQQYVGSGGHGVSIVILPEIPSTSSDVGQIAQSLTKGAYVSADIPPELNWGYRLLYFAL